MNFENTYLLFSLLIIPLLVFIYILNRIWRKKALAKYGDLDVVNQLIDDKSLNRPVFKFIAMMLALCFMIIGMANPRTGSKLEKSKHKGIDVMIAIDISNSMLSNDIKPSRLERSKMAISKLVDKLEDDQIGLVVFAGQAQSILPITPDFSAAKMFVNDVSTDMLSTQGTAIGAAIDLCASSTDKKSKNKKAIIVISDGENHEDDAVLAAENAAKQGVIVYTIGMGSADGGPIPINGNNGLQSEYKKDKDGNTVVTKLNEQMLEQIAAAGKGIYVRASNNDTGLDKIFSDINKIDKKEYEAKNFSDYTNLFQYFLAVCLLLLIAEQLIFERKTSLTRNLHLFDRK
jgi:Ca-activated chloride channel family protein